MLPALTPMEPNASGAPSFSARASPWASATTNDNDNNDNDNSNATNSNNNSKGRSRFVTLFATCEEHVC